MDLVLWVSLGTANVSLNQFFCNNTQKNKKLSLLWGREIDLYLHFDLISR